MQGLVFAGVLEDVHRLTPRYPQLTVDNFGCSARSGCINIVQVAEKARFFIGKVFPSLHLTVDNHVRALYTAHLF